MPGSQKTIIVAEDEPLVRMLAAEHLADAGYVVVEAADAGEALDAIRVRGGQVVALFTDVHMPGNRNGLELAQLVHRRWPRVAILVTSGQHRLADGELPDGGMFVTKPYELEHIVSHLGILIAAKA